LDVAAASASSAHNNRVKPALQSASFARLGLNEMLGGPPALVHKYSQSLARVDKLTL
jgi:hypothetical protein